MFFVFLVISIESAGCSQSRSISSSVSISGCSFSRTSSSTDGGGAFYMEGVFTVSIISTTFTKCTSNGYGGAMRAVGQNSGTLKLTMTNCGFTECCCLAEDTGGGAFSTDSTNGICSTTCTSCTFSGCSVIHYGGTFDFRGSYIGYTTMIDCSIVDSYGFYGGACMVHAKGQFKLNLTGCILRNCRCVSQGGGIMYWSQVGTNTFYITNTQFYFCTAEWNEGGVKCEATGESKLTSTIKNCLFQFCSGNIGGGCRVISCDTARSSLTISYCNFSGCTAPDGASLAVVGEQTGTTSVSMTSCDSENCTASRSAIFGFAHDSSTVTLSAKYCSTTNCRGSNSMAFFFHI